MTMASIFVGPATLYMVLNTMPPFVIASVDILIKMFPNSDDRVNVHPRKWRLYC